MNREIKFRGKRTDEGGWIYGNLCSYLFDCAKELTPCIHIGKKGYIRNGFYQVDPSTVGQYTGLNDCNGKEIYEKDIVRISIRPTAEEAKANKRNTKLMGIQMPSWMNGGDVIARVSYFDCAFHFIHLKSFLPDSNRLIQEPMLHYLYDERHPDTPHIFDQTIEVIGNIFDNPELLKKMTNRQFFDLVVQLRLCQKEYFATRSRQSLEQAKALEKRVDDEITRV